MNTDIMELNTAQLEAVFGGVTHKNPTPSKLDGGIDGILNGKNYDWLAQMITNVLNGDDVRGRKVDSNVDIYDTVI